MVHLDLVDVVKVFGGVVGKCVNVWLLCSVVNFWLVNSWLVRVSGKSDVDIAVVNAFGEVAVEQEGSLRTEVEVVR